MNNFKHPQYLTRNGFVRTAGRPKLKTPQLSVSASSESTQKLPQMPSKLRTLVEKRVLAKQVLQRREKGLSDEAAKMIAEAIKTMLRS
jgi:hypothetical protein